MAETVNQENMNGTETESTPKTFTQEEVNAMMAERVKREQSKFADYERQKNMIRHRRLPSRRSKNSRRRLQGWKQN